MIFAVDNHFSQNSAETICTFNTNGDSNVSLFRSIAPFSTPRRPHWTRCPINTLSIWCFDCNLLLWTVSVRHGKAKSGPSLVLVRSKTSDMDRQSSLKSCTGLTSPHSVRTWSEPICLKPRFAFKFSSKFSWSKALKSAFWFDVTCNYQWSAAMMT